MTLSLFLWNEIEMVDSFLIIDVKAINVHPQKLQWMYSVCYIVGGPSQRWLYWTSTPLTQLRYSQWRLLQTNTSFVIVGDLFQIWRINNGLDLRKSLSGNLKKWKFYPTVCVVVLEALVTPLKCVSFQIKQRYWGSETYCSYCIFTGKKRRKSETK